MNTQIEQLKTAILHKLTSFKDFYQLSSPEAIKRYKDSVTKRTPKDLIARAKLELIISVFNGEWKADFKDGKQEKFYCYFQQTPSGFGFSFTGYNCANTGADVGARLCFKNESDAEHVSKTFVKLFEQALTYMN